MLKRLPDDPTNWLLIKERDPAARPLDDYDVLAEEPNSVVTGRPVDEEAPAPPAPRKAAPRKARRKIAGAVAAADALAPGRPQLATPADAAPRGKGWLHEIKYDGYRTLVFVDEGKVRLITRNGHDWTDRYGAPRQGVRETAVQERHPRRGGGRAGPARRHLLDLLEKALSERDTHALTYFAFDLCYLDGHDFSGARLVDRKRALEALIEPLIDARSPIQFSEHIDGDGDALFVQASRMGLEGIVCKQGDARYVQARSTTWLKVKRVERRDLPRSSASSPTCPRPPPP